MQTRKESICGQKQIWFLALFAVVSVLAGWTAWHFIFDVKMIQAAENNAFAILKTEVTGKADEQGQIQVVERYRLRFEKDAAQIDFVVRPQDEAVLSKIKMAVQRHKNVATATNLLEDAVLVGDGYGRTNETSVVSDGKKDNQNSNVTKNNTLGGTPLLVFQLAKPLYQRQEITLRGTFAQGSEATIELSYVLKNSITRSEVKSFAHIMLRSLVSSVDSLDMQYVFTASTSLNKAEVGVLSATLADVQVNQSQANQIVLDIRKLRHNDLGELVMVLPVRLFPKMVSDGRLDSEVVIAARMESNRASLERSLRQLPMLRQSVVGIAIALTLILLVAVVYVQRRFLCALTGKKRLSEKTFRAHPGLFGGLRRHNLHANALMATMLDLVRRKELKLDGQLFSLCHPDQNDYTEFAPFEVFLLQWLRDQISSSKTDFSMCDFERYLTAKTGAFQFTVTLNQFRQLVLAQLAEVKAINHSRIRLLRLAMAIVASGIAIFMMALLILGERVGLVLVLPLCGYVAGAIFTSDMTDAGRKLAEVLYRFKFWLRRVEKNSAAKNQDLFAMNNSSIDQHIARLLPIAVALNEFETFFILLDRLPKAECRLAKIELLSTYRFGYAEFGKTNVHNVDDEKLEISIKEMVDDLRIVIHKLRQLFARFDRERRRLFRK